MVQTSLNTGNIRHENEEHTSSIKAYDGREHLCSTIQPRLPLHFGSLLELWDNTQTLMKSTIACNQFDDHQLTNFIGHLL